MAARHCLLTRPAFSRSSIGRKDSTPPSTPVTNASSRRRTNAADDESAQHNERYFLGKSALNGPLSHSWRCSLLALFPPPSMTALPSSVISTDPLRRWIGQRRASSLLLVDVVA